ncbi:DEAD/DEAH box helicase [Halocola ammonii]
MTLFQELGLKPEIVQAVEQLGFEKPSEIQSKAIPPLIETPQDLIGLAQTGTGKTAAFGLPLGHLIDFSKKHVQAVVICPTRELCNQIHADFTTFLQFTDNARVVAIYGGASFGEQLKQLDKKPQIIVATPGRLMDMMNRRKIDLSRIDYCVLDEADEMLNMGFKEDIDEILSQTNEDKKVWLFSATMPPEIARITKEYMTNPLEVTAGTKNSSAENLEHHYFIVDGRQRFTVLKRTLDFWPDMYGLVFCQTRRQVIEAAEKLAKAGYPVDALHGDLSQMQRDSVMKKFRERSIKVLVATDVAARGIDVDDITHVVHYTLPDEIENYTHRSGRTARAGKSGMSIALVTPRETGKIKAIEKKIGKPMQHSKVPAGDEVLESQLVHYLDKLIEVPLGQKNVQPWLELAYDELAQFSKEELIEKLVAHQLSDIMADHADAADLNRKPADSKQEYYGSDNDRFQTVFMSLGKLDQFDKGSLLRFICDNAGITGEHVGRIDIKREFSFVDIDKDQAQKVAKALSGLKIKGRSVKADISDKGPGKRKGGGGGHKGGYKGKGKGKKSFDKGGKGKPNFRAKRKN